MKSSKQGGFSHLNINKNFSDNTQVLQGNQGNEPQPKMPAIAANTGSKSTLSNISPHLRPKLKGSQNDFGNQGIMSISGDNSTTTLKLTSGVGNNRFSADDQPYLPQQAGFN
eukprot:CAMPEP_0170506866 /NCGR_PEP_ID=MMETSP0208-20121228/56601_1 /TAXON_ID=197538 /ORGANISM="Strombidium inclinatum, Strain S3" /LENGTH=111 /DNA_ID=CAMNT_0010788679 /DNA_START=1060 /DNA_END=1395 /DNA_ORIENTATION=-